MASNGALLRYPFESYERFARAPAGQCGRASAARFVEGNCGISRAAESAPFSAGSVKKACPFIDWHMPSGGPCSPTLQSWTTGGRAVRSRTPVNPSTVTSAIVEPRLERVTSATAATFWTALSSDARMVVYVSDAGQDGATPQVWVQQVGGAAVQLTHDMRECAEPSFTPDGTRVIFSAVVDSTRHVYQIPTLGGTPQMLKRAARNARYSPDGRWLLYLPFDSENTVRLVSADGTIASW